MGLLDRGAQSIKDVVLRGLGIGCRCHDNTLGSYAAGGVNDFSPLHGLVAVGACRIVSLIHNDDAASCPLGDEVKFLLRQFGWLFRLGLFVMRLLFLYGVLVRKESVGCHVVGVGIGDE